MHALRSASSYHRTSNRTNTEMAIPFNLPRNPETEENYEVLDLLFEQLYEIVRQIILRRRGRRPAENLPPPPVIQPRHRDAERRDAGGDGGNGAGNAEPSVTQNQQQATDSSAMRRVTALPDLIPTTDNTSAPPEAPIPPPRRGAPSYGVRPPRPPPRRPRRRRSTCCDDKTPGVPSDHTTCEDWQRIGKQLRKIAIDFRGSGLEAEGPQTPQPLHNTKEEESLLSLLLPSPLSGSILTAVIFLVGWRFLARRG